MKTKSQDRERVRRELLEVIAGASQSSREIQDEFRRNPPPTLELLIKVHRSWVMKLINDLDDPPKPEDMRVVTALLKPAMEFASLEEKRADRRLVRERLRAARQSLIDAGIEAVAHEFRKHPAALELVRRGFAMATGKNTAEVAGPKELPPAPTATIEISRPVGPPTDSPCRTENGSPPPCKP